MRKIILLFVLTVGFSVSLPTLALGVDSTGSAGTNQNSEIQNRIEEQKEIREQNRLEIQNALQEKKEELLTLREQKREEFHLRLQEIKDAKKQKIFENLDKSYVNINNRWTTHFKNVLARLTKILDKVKIRAENQENSEVLDSINDIYNQIEQTEAAVEVQTAKTYTIDITAEDKLGEAAKAVHSQLRSDLQALREQIKDIREAVRGVILTLQQPKVTIEPTS